MGLSIHYSGRLKQAHLLGNLIEEIRDVTKANNWEYHIFETVFPGNTFSKEAVYDSFFGIIFTPKKCEPISVVFLSNGIMVCPLRANFFAKSPKIEERDYIYGISVKTQFAGIAVHQLIILLFKYLNQKYFDNFELSDESSYWETEDENKMKEQFEIYNKLADNFALAIETIPLHKNEDVMTYIERLMEIIRNKKEQ